MQLFKQNGGTLNTKGFSIVINVLGFYFYYCFHCST